jgi:hypothetical protein
MCGLGRDGASRRCGRWILASMGSAPASQRTRSSTFDWLRCTLWLAMRLPGDQPK